MRTRRSPFIPKCGTNSDAAKAYAPLQLGYGSRRKAVSSRRSGRSVKPRALLACVTVGSALIGYVLAAHADPVADFYKGRRIELVISAGPGGGYDTYARLLARFIGRHIPGTPVLVPQNMPGAGGLSAANWMYNIAPKDGTILGTLAQSTPTDQVLGERENKFDVRKFGWIGNMVVVNNVLFVSSDTGVKTIEDARSRELSMGATGSSTSVLYAQVSNNLLGTKFKIITGYPGGGDINIAFERRELDGRGSDSWASLKSTHPEWLRDNRINILFQVGPRKESDLDAPLWSALAKTSEERQVLQLLSGDVAVGRPIVTTPDVPAERVLALRRAFDETVKDPDFIAEAARANMYINPIGGEELQRVVERMVSASPDVVAKAKQAIASSNKAHP